MIRIGRGPEPGGLPAARAKGIARALLARRDGKALVFEGYNLPSVRGQLYEDQHSKCAYCERGIGQTGQPIEHFRPKQGADRGDPFTSEHSIDADRYWWLAWNWSNLLLSCSTCNTPTFKGNRFPLEPDSLEIASPDGVIHDDHPCFAVEIESPSLLDPAWDDPLDHITWRPLNPAFPDGPWRAFHRTERGRVTIHILGLDGRNVDRAGDHIRNVVKPHVVRVIDALAREDHVAARQAWENALDCLFAPAQPFHAATHDALDFLVPAEARERAGLVLRRPGAPRTARPKATPMERERYTGLPDDVVLHLLADVASTAEQIMLVCQTRPSTLTQLIELLGVSEATVRRHCSRLVGLGKLAIDENQQYVLAASGSTTAE